MLTLSMGNVQYECKREHCLHDLGGLSCSGGHNEWGWWAYTPPTVHDIYMYICHSVFSVSSLIPMWFAMWCLYFVWALFYCKICFRVSKYWLSSEGILWTYCYEPTFKIRLPTENYKPVVMLGVSGCGLYVGKSSFC